jgi:hypothetical protein
MRRAEGLGAVGITAATVIAALSWTPIALSGLMVLVARQGGGPRVRAAGPYACRVLHRSGGCGLTLIVALVRYRRYRGAGSVVAATAAGLGLIISVLVWPTVVLPGW